MAKNSKLESGFLFLYDWLPAIENLPAKEVKALLLALIARQRENKPLPLFHNALTASYARMIEPSIKRRLDGATGKKAAQKPARQEGDGGEDGWGDGGENPTPLSRAEKSREKKKKDKSFFKGSEATAPQGAETGAREGGARGGVTAHAAHTQKEGVCVFSGGTAAKGRGFAAKKGSTRTSSATASSFDVDDFFGAALAAAYKGQDFT